MISVKNVLIKLRLLRMCLFSKAIVNETPGTSQVPSPRRLGVPMWFFLDPSGTELRCSGWHRMLHYCGNDAEGLGMVVHSCQGG